jgi:hypothetical protein
MKKNGSLRAAPRFDLGLAGVEARVSTPGSASKRLVAGGDSNETNAFQRGRRQLSDSCDLLVGELPSHRKSKRFMASPPVALSEL